MQEKGHYRRWGVIGCLVCTWNMVSKEEYAANQHAPKNERQICDRGSDGSYYRIRWFRVSELHHVWNTGDKTEDRRALCDAKERFGERTTRNNMDALMFGRLLMHLCDTYRSGGAKLVRQFDNATFHSRRSDHWVSHIEVGGGRLAQRGWSRGLGEWAASKCAGWLTGSAAKIGGEVAKERCRLALRSLTVDYPGEASLVDLAKQVAERLPSRGATAKEASSKYRDIVLRTASPLKFEAWSILADLGYAADRTPPCEKRPNWAELWWDTVKNFYRVASDAERRDTGGSSTVSERLKRTSDREAAWYLSHTGDFALAVADRRYDVISRAAPDLYAALRGWGREMEDA